MKRFFLVILIASILLPLLCACDGDAATSSSSDESMQVSDTSTSANADESDDESKDESTDESEEPYSPDVNEHGAFRFSSIDDVTDGQGKRSYTVYAPYTDTYS